MSNGLLENVYNPDVLSCLANLSNDEVFTSPDLVNKMLDMLPQELFTDPNIKFLDPACKTGVFLREIAKRLIKGLEKEIPDFDERINHIFKNQLYGIAVTELTSLLSRRSVYCSKWPNGEYSIVRFKNPEGNIKFKMTKHVWKNNKCKYCGAPQAQYDRNSNMEQYAYEFIHVDDAEEIFNMKFDVIIGNPPYQLSDGGGTGDSAKPIYQLFIQQAKKLNPRYLTMIVPSRWMKGGKGLDNFRKEMMEDKRIKYIYDFEDAKECFPGIHLDGGVNYFLWDKSYQGMCEYHYKALNEKENKSTRYLKNDISGTVIRDYNQISIINKATEYHEEKFSKICSARNPFGFYSDLFNEPEKYPKAKLSMEEDENKLRVYGVRGKKGGSKRVVGYVDKESVEKLKEDVGKYKLYFSKAYTTTATVPPEIIIGVPNTVCTETFIEIGTFETEQEARNCLSYIKTKFFRALLLYNRHSLNISRESFDLIPLQNFDEEWDDAKLYEKYNLTTEEIKFIEDNILEMKGE